MLPRVDNHDESARVNLECAVGPIVKNVPTRYTCSPKHGSSIATPYALRRQSRRILDGVREGGPEEAAYAVYGMLIYLTYWYDEHGSLKSHRQVSGDHS